GLRKTVFPEVRDLFHPYQHRRKRFDVHRRVRVEIVPVLVNAIPKRADGKYTEVGIDGEEMDHVTHLDEHDRTQSHQNNETEDERHPTHLQKVCRLERFHADVVIEIVDLVQMLTVQPAALDFVRKNVE